MSYYSLHFSIIKFYSSYFVYHTVFYVLYNCFHTIFLIKLINYIYTYTLMFDFVCLREVSRSVVIKHTSGYMCYVRNITTI
jgi:hypothetical protein